MPAMLGLGIQLLSGTRRQLYSGIWISRFRTSSGRFRRRRGRLRARNGCRRRRAGTSARSFRSRRCGGPRRWALPGSMSARNSAAAGSAGRRRDHLRGAGGGLRLDRGLSLDPQHGVVDGRPLWRPRAARPLPARPRQHETPRQLLPDRAGQRLGRSSAGDPRPPRRRRLRAERHQGVHLGRRDLRPLRRDGADRRRGAAGISCLVVEKGAHGPLVRQEGKKLGWNTPADGHGDFDNCRVPIANRLGDEGHGFKSR